MGAAHRHVGSDPLLPVAARTIRVNGISVASKAALQHGDIIELPDVFIRFQRVPDTPRNAAKDFNEINLKRLKRLMIGRADGQEKAPEKLALDAADLSISREHVLLERTRQVTGSRWTKARPAPR